MAEDKLRSLLLTAVGRAFGRYAQQRDNGRELMDRFGSGIVDEILAKGARERLREFLNEDS